MKLIQSIVIIHKSRLNRHAIKSRLTVSVWQSRCAVPTGILVWCGRSSARTFRPRCVWSTDMHLVSLLRRDSNGCPDFTPVALNMFLLEDSGIYMHILYKYHLFTPHTQPHIHAYILCIYISIHIVR